MFNDDWRTYLREHYNNAYERLCECRNTRADIKIMARLVKRYNPNKTASECLERILVWVGDWNSQIEVADLTTEEYEEILASI